MRLLLTIFLFMFLINSCFGDGCNSKSNGKLKDYDLFYATGDVWNKFDKQCLGKKSCTMTVMKANSKVTFKFSSKSSIKSNKYMGGMMSMIVGHIGYDNLLSKSTNAPTQCTYNQDGVKVTMSVK